MLSGKKTKNKLCQNPKREPRLLLTEWHFAVYPPLYICIELMETPGYSRQRDSGLWRLRQAPGCGSEPVWRGAEPMKSPQRIRHPQLHVALMRRVRDFLTTLFCLNALAFFSFFSPPFLRPFFFFSFHPSSLPSSLCKQQSHIVSGAQTPTAPCISYFQICTATSRMATGIWNDYISELKPLGEIKKKKKIWPFPFAVVT